MRKLLILALVSFGIPTMSAQTMAVKIVNRQSNETDYSYVVPGHTTTNSNTSVNCFGTENSVNCSGTTIGTGLSTPGQEVSYHVRGATFTLQLPDGRAAVVNCEGKFSERLAGPRGNHRSCRIPLVDSVQVTFKGDKAKLMWPVSLDGKKMESETYKILALRTN